MKDMFRCGASLRHVALRICSDGGKLRMPVAKDTMLLFERAVVHEPVGLEDYPLEVRDLACVTIEPTPSKWCLSPGESIESKAGSSHLPQILHFRCQVAKMLRFSATDWNATLHVSPYKNCVAVVTTADLAEGDVIVVNEIPVKHEPIDSIDSMKQKIDAVTKDIERWQSVGLDDEVSELEQMRDSLTKEMMDELMTLDDCPHTFFTEARVDPNFLPAEPPVLTRLDCEKALQVMDIREKLGVRDVQQSLMEALEAFKKS